MTNKLRSILASLILIGCTIPPDDEAIPGLVSSRQSGTFVMMRHVIKQSHLIASIGVANSQSSFRIDADTPSDKWHDDHLP
jgi:hypothetical protein